MLIIWLQLLLIFLIEITTAAIKNVCIINIIIMKQTIIESTVKTKKERKE